MTEGKYLRGINPLFLDHTLENDEFEGFDFSYEKDGVTYDINRWGYRGQSFHKNAGLLALGCSHTFGLGIPKEYTWPELIKSDYITTVDSIAVCGDSAMGQVIKFFQYVKTYGNPKNVVALLPAYRMQFPLDVNKWEISENSKKYTKIHRDRASISLHTLDDSNFKKYTKSPYDPNDLMTKNVATYFTHTFVDMLDTYCKTHGINFKFSFYDHDYRIYNLQSKRYKDSLLEFMINNNKNYFSWIYPVNNLVISDEEINLNCHQKFNTDEYFLRANDYVPNKIVGHKGLHEHLHIAEAAKKALFKGFQFYEIDVKNSLGDFNDYKN